MSDNYPKDPEAISRLTPEQYRVTQQKGTVPLEDLEREGYGAYRNLFEPAPGTRSAS